MPPKAGDPRNALKPGASGQRSASFSDHLRLSRSLIKQAAAYPTAKENQIPTKIEIWFSYLFSFDQDLHLVSFS